MLFGLLKEINKRLLGIFSKVAMSGFEFFTINSFKNVPKLEKPYLGKSIRFNFLLVFIMFILCTSYFFALFHSFGTKWAEEYFYILYPCSTLLSFVIIWYALVELTPFHVETDISHFTKHRKGYLYKCPGGFVRNSTRLKSIFYSSHPLHRVEKKRKIYPEVVFDILMSSENEQKLKIFYRVSYNFVNQLQIIAGTKGLIAMIFWIELCVIVGDLILNQEITFTNTHLFNILVFLMLSSVHTRYYLLSKNKSSIQYAYISIANEIYKILNRELRQKQKIEVKA